MHTLTKSFLAGALAVSALGVHQSSAAETTANYSVNLSVASSFWQGPLYISFVTVTGTETLQTQDNSQEGLLNGKTVASKFGNKNILPPGSKGKLVAVWNDGSPYLAAFTKVGKAPGELTKLNGYSIGILQLQDPEDEASTINGALALKVSGNLIVPATDNISVPKTAQSVSGITRYTFVIADTKPLSPEQPIQGWGSYNQNFKKLFSGKATLTGAATVEL